MSFPSTVPFERVTLGCACRKFTSVCASEVDLAEFLRVSIRDGWRDIDGEPQVKRSPGGLDFFFSGVCSECVEWFKRLAGMIVCDSEALIESDDAERFLNLAKRA